MLARLIMALLLAAFAVPTAAPAACHDASTTRSHAAMAMTADPTDAMPGSPDRKAMPVHGCIGCIPPSTWIAARIAPVLPAGTAMPVARAAVLDIGKDTAPALRPPRTA